MSAMLQVSNLISLQEAKQATKQSSEAVAQGSNIMVSFSMIDELLSLMFGKILTLITITSVLHISIMIMQFY